jgi:ankyrin repeat protein
MAAEEATMQLLLAVMDGNLSAARSAIEAGANVNAMDVNQATPLHWAAALAQVELVRLLIDNGADIHARNYAQQTPLDLAQKAGYRDVAAILSNGVQ